MLTRFVGLLLVLLLTFPALAQIHVRVIQVLDGDTVKVRHASGLVRTVRLANIDAPEKKQPGGSEAAAALSDVCLNKTATLWIKSTDRYGRTIGKLVVNGTDLSQRQVVMGNAWVYRAYCDSLPAWEPWELQARTNRIGIWKVGGPPPEPPWEFRKRSKK